MTFRTFSLALALAAATGVVAVVQPPARDGLLMKSALFTWESAPERPTEQGGRRAVFAEPTATLDELEYHTAALGTKAASAEAK